MGIRHPWEITLREFVEKVRRDYGIEVREVLRDNLVIFRKADRLYVLPRLDSEEILKPDALRELCRMFSLPPLDFSLDPEEDD